MNRRRIDGIEATKRPKLKPIINLLIARHALSNGPSIIHVDDGDDDDDDQTD